MSLSAWTPLDYLFVLLILTSTGFAVFKGLVRELISLIALVAGFFLAAWFYPVISSRLSDFARNQTVADFMGFLAIFLSCLILGAVTAFIVKRLVKMASLEWMDYLLGAVFGLLRGCAVASIIVLALIAFPVREGLVERSLFAPYLLAGARAAVWMVPQEMKNKFNEQYKKVLQTWNESRKSQ
jgi:membrane protein required for colicin V production